MAYIREVPPSVRHPRSRFRVYHETKQGEVKVGEYESKRAAERTRDSVNRHGLEAVLHPNQTEAGGEAAEPAPPPPPTAVAGNEKAQTPFGQYLADKWWPAWKPAHPDSAQGTRYKLNKRVIPRFGNIPLGDLDADTIGRWRGEMVAEQLSPRTVNTYVSLVGTILNAAVDNSYLERSPLLRRSGAGRVPNVKNLPADAREVWLTRAQLNTLASTIAARYRALVLVAALTGLRWGELIALRWGDLHLDAPFDDGAVQGVGRVRITKAVSDPSRSGKGRQRGPKTKAGRREIALDQETVAALTAHRKLVGDEDDELVFTSPGGSRGNGGQLSSSNFARVWKEALKDAKLAHLWPDYRGLHFHDLRHTHATWLIARQIPSIAVAKRLGHASPVVTMMVYAHVTELVQARSLSAKDLGLTNGQRPSGPAPRRHPASADAAVRATAKGSRRGPSSRRRKAEAAASRRRGRGQGRSFLLD